MASPTVFVVLLFLVAPSVAAFREYVEADSARFLLLDCGGSPDSSTRGPQHLEAAASKNSSVASRANLRELLAVLPSVAAPQGSGVLFCGGASARGVCVGESSRQDCHACLAAAARNVTSACGLAGRRGGAWSDACFLTYYADANSSAAAADDRRRVSCHGDFPSSYLDDRHPAYLYPTWPDVTFARLAYELARRAAADPARMHAAADARAAYSYRHLVKVRAVAQCARDRGTAACVTCLRASAWQAVLSCPAVGTGWMQGGRVVSDGCYLRFEVTVDDASVSAGASAGAVLRSWLIGGAFAAAALHAPLGI